MNDFGTVYKRTVGMDSNGFLIRMFPKVTYRPLKKDRPPKPYFHFGQCCLLPLDSCNPVGMMREVYGMTNDEIGSCMASLVSKPTQEYIDMDQAEFDKLPPAERQAVKSALIDGNPVVWMTAPQQRAVPLEDGVVVLILYRRVTHKANKQARMAYDYEADFEPRRKLTTDDLKASYTEELKEAFLEHRKSFKITSGHIIDNASYGDWVVPEVLNGPGERWSSVAFDAGIIPTLDRIAHNIVGQYGWQTHQHDKVMAALNSHTHTTYDSTFTIYF